MQRSQAYVCSIRLRFVVALSVRLVSLYDKAIRPQPILVRILDVFTYSLSLHIKYQPSFFFSAKVPLNGVSTRFIYSLYLDASWYLRISAWCSCQYICGTMGPHGHGGSAQTVDPPYTITLQSQFYNCGENLLGKFYRFVSL